METLAKPESQTQPLDESILKPKQRKAPSFTPEQRQAMSDRMKKVNAERISKSKTAEQLKVREQKNLEKEQKRIELEQEIERLRKEVAEQPARLQPVPKKKYARKVKEMPEHEPNYEQLIQKTREVKRVQIPDPEPETDSESDDEPPPPPKSRKPRVSKQPTQPEPPKLVCKFL
jgi:hypothetical protein